MTAYLIVVDDQYEAITREKDEADVLAQWFRQKDGITVVEVRKLKEFPYFVTLLE